MIEDQEVKAWTKEGLMFIKTTDHDILSKWNVRGGDEDTETQMLSPTQPYRPSSS